MKCDYCGMDQTGGSQTDTASYCCAGCRMRGLVPVDAAGNFPVNGELVRVLVVGFIAFNQVLAWGLSYLSSRQGKLEWAVSAARAEVILAGGTWIGLAWLQWRARPYQGKDYVMALVTLALLMAAFGRGLPPSGALLAAANAAFAFWCFRGVTRKRENAPRA